MQKQRSSIYLSEAGDPICAPFLCPDFVTGLLSALTTRQGRLGTRSRPLSAPSLPRCIFSRGIRRSLFRMGGVLLRSSAHRPLVASFISITERWCSVISTTYFRVVVRSIATVVSRSQCSQEVGERGRERERERDGGSAEGAHNHLVICNDLVASKTLPCHRIASRGILSMPVPGSSGSITEVLRSRLTDAAL